MIKIGKKFVTYAQEFEDCILFCVLNWIEKGFYVDVGANDPAILSVTKAFYDRGWNGINIEPLREEYSKLCRDRPRDINLNIGVGGENGEKEFAVLGASTTCDMDEILKLQDEIGVLNKKILPIRKLSDVLREYEDEHGKQTIHFCKIDVEGSERDVLEGMNLEACRPWVMLLEAAFPGTHMPNHDRWEDLLVGNGYEYVFSYGINRYYVDTRLDRGTLLRLRDGFRDAELCGKGEYDFVRQSNPDKILNGYMLLRFTRDFIKKIALGEITFNEYITRRRAIKVFANIPLLKEIEWFGKFILLRRD
ncbi:MAG: FkbM family methyltransferase [Synergistaceae bacterium]|nr:FkbM family methyltransferase [Synergistaceae bacterium]